MGGWVAGRTNKREGGGGLLIGGWTDGRISGRAGDGLLSGWLDG